MSDAVQTSYADPPAVGLPGDEYDCSFSDIVSWVAAEAVPFGAFVMQTAEGQGELPDSSGEVTGFEGGIALRDPALASGEGYLAGDVMRVMRRGRAVGLNEETMALGDTVYVRHTAGVGEQKGSLRHDADTADAATPTGIKVYKGGAAGRCVFELGVGGATGPQGPQGPQGA